MSTGDSFHLAIVTPERSVLDCEARSASFPAWDGEMGVLAHRAPLLCRLGIGVMRVERAGGHATERLFVDGGFAQMVDNKLTILTEQARRPDEVDLEAVRGELEEARDQRIGPEISWEERDAAIRRAQARIDLASPGSS